MKILHKLQKCSGTYVGQGVNHEGQAFTGTLVLLPKFDGKGFTLDFTAKGADGSVYHREHSLLGPTPSQKISLWVMSTNHPGVMEHTLTEREATPGAEASLFFQMGDLKNRDTFREEIVLDLWPGGDLSYRYFYGVSGGDFQERSGARMSWLKNTPIKEAKIKRTDQGVIPEGPGWYVINAKDSVWSTNAKFGRSTGFEGSERFEQYGVNIHVLNPGQPNCHYHGEDDQEDFLVLEGECKLLIEGEERELKAWDFVHCPKWARHVFVGAGEKPCAILMMGGRTGHGVIYPCPPLVQKYDACPSKETDSPKESYASCPDSVKERSGWPL